MCSAECCSVMQLLCSFGWKSYITPVKELIFDKVVGLQLHDYFSSLFSTNGKQLPWRFHEQPWSRSKKINVLHETCYGIHFWWSYKSITLVKNNYFIFDDLREEQLFFRHLSMFNFEWTMRFWTKCKAFFPSRYLVVQSQQWRNETLEQSMKYVRS